MLDEIANLGSKKDSALSALHNLARTREVEVDLPILKTKVMVRPIVGGEELKLHTMKASGSTFIKEFDKLLFEHCVFNELKFANLQDFIKHLCPADKAMIVQALLDATFSKLPEKIITCPDCDQVDTYTPEPSELLHGDSIKRVWNKDIDFEDYEVQSEIIPGFTVVYGMPTEQDKLDLLEVKENSEMREQLEETNDLLNNIEIFSIYIKKMIIANPTDDDKDNTLILTDKVKDIIPTIMSMGLDLKSTLLEDETINEFADFIPNFYLNIKCSNLACGKQFKWEGVNPEQDFFRKALSVYN